MFSNGVFDMLHVCKTQGALHSQDQDALHLLAMWVLLHIPANQAGNHYGVYHPLGVALCFDAVCLGALHKGVSKQPPYQAFACHEYSPVIHNPLLGSY